MQYTQAYKLAAKIVSTLSPHCMLIHIAGSIRRKKKEAGDIEIVCRPHSFMQQNLFGDACKEERSPKFIEAAANLGNLTTGNIATGRQCKIQLPEGILLDIYMPVAAHYYRQLAIRTGSAEYARHVIAGGWRRLGWCGVKETGLLRIKECYRQNGNWHCDKKQPQIPPVWSNEKEFFTWLRVLYLEPELRELTQAQINKIVNEYYESNNLK